MIYMVPDTCIVFGYVNEADLFHNDCEDVFGLVFNRVFTGIMLEVVHEEFGDVLGYKFYLIVQEFVKLFKQMGASIGSDAVLTRIKNQNSKLANFITFIMKAFPLNNIDDVSKVISKIYDARDTLRKNEMELIKTLRWRKTIDDLETQRMMRELVNDKTIIGLDDKDKSILVQAGYLGRKISTFLVTTDGKMVGWV